MPRVVPSWVWNPRRKVLGIVLGWLVGGLSVVLHAIVNGIWSPIDSALTAAEMAGDAIDSSVASVADAIVGAERSVTSTFIDLGASSGLAAPLTTAAIVLGTFGIVFVVVFVVVQVAKVVNPQ